MGAIKCNFCGIRGLGYDCKGQYPPKLKCLLVDAELHFEGDDGVWRTPDGREAMRYRRAGLPDPT